MASLPILACFAHLRQGGQPSPEAASRPDWLENRPSLHQLAQNEASLPAFVRESPVAMRYLRLLGPLDWDNFPERDLQQYRHIPPVPYRPFVAACLVKLDQQITYMAHLHQYLVEHPALVWALGFPLLPSDDFPWGFNPEAGLPTQRHFTRMLRTVPQPCLQFLLDDTVGLIQVELATEVDDFGQSVSLDTKVG